MGFSLGGGKSSSSNNSSFDQNVWAPQGNALEGMYGQGSNLFDWSNQGMQSNAPGAVDWMDQIKQQSLNPWNDQMQGGAYKDMGLQDSLMGSLTQSANQPSAMSEINAMTMGGEGNNYADAMKDTYMRDAGRANDMMLANTDRRAVGTGLPGSSRHGMVQGMGSEAITDKLQDNMARTGFETFDKDLQRKLEIAGQADQNTMGRQQMMQQMLASQQGAMGSGLNYGGNMQNLGMGSMAPYMAPWQAAGQYGSLMGDPTVLGSGSSSGKSSSWNASGTSS